MLRYTTAVDRLIEASRGYRFRGKFRLFDPFVPHEGEKRASVFGYEMSLDLQTESAARRLHRQLRTHRDQPRLLFRETGNDRAGHRREHRLLHRARCADGGSGWPSIRGRALPTQFYPTDGWIRNNNVGQVRAFNFALGAAPGTAQMFSAFAHPGAPVMVEHNQPSVAVVEVRTLDSCLDEWKLDRVDFLKLDVDGSETAVLAGARDTLAAHKIRAILCEFSTEWLARVGSSAEALWATL